MPSFPSLSALGWVLSPALIGQERPCSCQTARSQHFPTGTKFKKFAIRHYEPAGDRAETSKVDRKINLKRLGGMVSRVTCELLCSSTDSSTPSGCPSSPHSTPAGRVTGTVRLAPLTVSSDARPMRCPPCQGTRCWETSALAPCMREPAVPRSSTVPSFPTSALIHPLLRASAAFHKSQCESPARYASE